jgi:glycosyltransferase involved in cell wall biosynthesis
VTAIPGQAADAGPALRVSLLTGGGDLHYAIPLAASLADQSVRLDMIVSEQFLSSPELKKPSIALHSLHGNADPGQPLHRKLLKVIRMYTGLIVHAAATDSTLFHILWHNKLPMFDMTVLAGYYKVLGKRIVFTAHNVDADERDGRSWTLGRMALRLFYRLTDHIFVHTSRMKQQLEQQFQVDARKITVIPFGMNTVVPKSGLTRRQARSRLGLGEAEKVVLFFGNITQYKGLEFLVRAVAMLKEQGAPPVKLLIAGNVKGRSARPYWDEIRAFIDAADLGSRVQQEVRLIPDEEVEGFFKAADVCVLPYVRVYQTGVLFLSYRFGLPVIGTDVGSVREDIVEGRTGSICRAADPAALARAIADYFNSPLFANLDRARGDIAGLADSKYAWNAIAPIIVRVYRQLQPRARAAHAKPPSWAASSD